LFLYNPKTGKKKDLTDFAFMNAGDEKKFESELKKQIEIFLKRVIMEWLNELAQNREAPLVAAFALGLLTAISPCPLATNITATAYIAKTITSKAKVLLSGLLYTLGRMLSYTALGSLIYFGASKFQVAKLFQGNGEKFIGPLMILIGLIMLGADPIRDFLSNLAI
jgi:sulfite exporter TauE/SafE